MSTESLFPKISNNNKICGICGSNKTFNRLRNGKLYPVWRTYNGKKICQNCYNRLVVNVKYERHKKYDGHELTFYNLRITLSFELPRDKCEICGVLKSQGKRIDRHHYFYCIIMPWACTISVCNSCHQKIGKKGKKYKKINKNFEKNEKIENFLE